MNGVLDSDILTLMEQKSEPAFSRIQFHLEEQRRAGVQTFTSIVSFQQETQGWLAYVNKARRSRELLRGYFKLLQAAERYGQTTILPFDQSALDKFDQLRAHKIRIGTLDLRIAAIALSLNYKVITRNLRDFRQVPGLIAEDWTV